MHKGGGATEKCTNHAKDGHKRSNRGGAYLNVVYEIYQLSNIPPQRQFCIQNEQEDISPPIKTIAVGL